jgi:hypothetical protein
MTEPDEADEARLRALFHEVASEIHPSRSAPDTTMSPSRPPRPSPVRLTMALAVCVAVILALVLAVRPWGHTETVKAALGPGGSGALLTVESGGAVVLLDPQTGAVLSTVVGPSPVDSDGRHLGQPEDVTTAGDVAYVAYETPTPVIERIPFAGGTPTYVADGSFPAVSPDGTQLAFSVFRTGSDTGGSTDWGVAVRDLATGAQRTVNETTAITVINRLSWSPDGTELAMSGIFVGPLPTTLSPGALEPNVNEGVQILALDQPLSASNPHFLGTPTTWSELQANEAAWADGQYLGSGGNVAVISGAVGGICEVTPSRVLSVDPATGQTGTVATFPYSVTSVVFDQSGDLVAVQRTLLPAECSDPTTTTTSTTTTTTTLAGLVPSSSSFSTGTVWTSSSQMVLDKWDAGTSSLLTDGVIAVTFVPAAS